MSSRFAPPTVRESLLRARLLSVLRERFDRRVIALVAGPGFGKTTLLVQAITENRLDPAGYDVWLGCDRDDSAASVLGSGVCTALGALAPETEQPDAVCEAVATAITRRGPAPVAILLDDVHEIDRDSGGAAVLARLVETLPLNGHLVLASRRPPPFPLARLVARGQAVRLDESALAFDDQELDRFGELRGVSAQALQELGRWPALAELVATAGAPSVHEFLWEELLAEMAPERRRHLAVLAAIGGGDSESLTAAIGEPVDADELVADLPLVTRGPHGSVSLHALWHDQLERELSGTERSGVLRRAALSARDAPHAFRLLAAAGAWDDALRLATKACSALHAHPSADVLESWLARLPGNLRSEPAARLLEGVMLRIRQADPDVSSSHLEQAAKEFRARGDVESELACLPHLAYIGYVHARAELVNDAIGRTFELEQAGVLEAVPFATLGRAALADFLGDASGAVSALASFPASALAPEWVTLRDWLHAEQLLTLGDPAAAGELAARARQNAPTELAHMLEGADLLARWLLGDVEAVVEAGTRTLEQAGISVSLTHRQAFLAQASRFAAFAGRVEEARGLLAEAEHVGGFPTTQAVARLALARAAIAVVGGDGPTATAALEELLGPDRQLPPQTERALRRSLTLPYVLVPEFRDAWDTAPLGPAFTIGLRLSRALVSLREGAVSPLKELEVPDPRLVRAWLPLPWSTHLAAGLAAAGRNEGAALVHALGPPARPWLHQLAASAPRPVATAAGRLLADLPTQPPFRLEIDVLGPTALRRDGVPVDAPDLRRERVQALLGYLILHRGATRDAIATALWPDLAPKSAGNNLRVSLSYLTRSLEPRGRRTFVLRPSDPSNAGAARWRPPARRRLGVRPPDRRGRRRGT